jgi:hypothetical protein
MESMISFFPCLSPVSFIAGCQGCHSTATLGRSSHWRGGATVTHRQPTAVVEVAV